MKTTRAVFVGILALALGASARASVITYLDSAQHVAAYGDNVYEYVTTPLTWQAALDAAPNNSWNGVPGHLVTVTSLAENNYLYEAFVGPQYAAAATPLVQEQATPWIALSDSAVEGVWRWMAGPEIGQITSFNNWNTGELNGGTVENYAVMHWQDRGLGTGKWYDYPGTFQEFFIVEFENAVNAVPLPATFSLFAAGLGALGLLNWRTQRRGS